MITIFSILLFIYILSVIILSLVYLVECVITKSYTFILKEYLIYACVPFVNTIVIIYLSTFYYSYLKDKYVKK